MINIKIRTLLCFHPVSGAPHEVDRREGFRGRAGSLIGACRAEVERRQGGEDQTEGGAGRRQQV